MPDEPLDPETEERVRRLLAEARHTGPMPADVADRMDRVLAGLADEPAAQGRVVRLADRRRRAATLLVAAAAVVAAGMGIGGIVHQQGVGAASQSADTAGGAAVRAPEAAGGPTKADRPQARRQPRSSGDSVAVDGLAAAMPVHIRPQHFSKDVARAQRHDLPLLEMDGNLSAYAYDGAVPLPECREPGWGNGRFVPVSYGASPGYLVFRTPAGDTQVADLFLCGVADAVRSITLPRP